MEMSVRWIYFLWLCAVCGGCTSAGKEDYEIPKNGPVLTAALIRDKGDWYNLKLDNKSGEFLCIDSSAFDTRRGFITIYDKNDNAVPLRSYADGPPDLDLGFDFIPPYIFMRPRERRSINIDILNFRATEGTYRYSLAIPVFMCRDIIDKSRIDAKKEIPSYGADGKGVIEIQQPPSISSP